MKTGILTFHFADNYGAVLQAYALREFIRNEYQEETFIINYANDNLKKAYSINPFEVKEFKQIIKRVLRLPICLSQRTKFNNFRKNELKLEKKYVDASCFNTFDRIIVGSDQVWNTKITYDDLNYFLVETGLDVKKIAYAASADDCIKESKCIQKIISAWKKFDYLSVREMQLKEYIGNEQKLTCELVVDPVFLQSRDFWQQICTRRYNDKKYILLYILKENKDLEEIAVKICKEKEIDLYVIHPTARRISKNGKQLYSVGPKEFVGLIRDAEIIVSNSFHAFAFSIIFSKEIYFESLIGTANRINSLIKLLDINIVKVNNSINKAKLNCYDSDLYKKIVISSKTFLEKSMRE